MTEREWMTCNDPARMLRLVHENPDHQNIQCCRSDRKLRLFACACCRQIWHLLTNDRSRRAVETAERYADSLADADELDAARQAAWAAAWPASPWVAARDAALAAIKGASWAAAWAAARGEVRYEARSEVRGAVRAVQSYTIRDIIGNPFRPLATESAYLGDTAMHDWMIATRQPGERNARNRLLPDAWLTPTVHFLAQAAYEERREDGTLDAVRLSILADALEEAGCDNEDLLRHFRSQTRCHRHETDLLRCRRCDSVQDRQFYPTHPALGYAVCGPCQTMEPLEPCPCVYCKSDGWMPSPGPHYRGCWALDLILGKE